MPFIAQQLSADGVASDGRVVLATAVNLIIKNDHVATVSVGTSGGTGYAVGDEFSIDDAGAIVTNVVVAVNGDNFRARCRVTSVSLGAVTGVELISAGAYTTLATDTDFSTSTTVGAGTGCQIDIDTIQTALWTEDDRTNFDNIDFQTDGDWLCTSVKAANAPLIGMRSDISASNDAVQLLVGTSYDNGLPWRDQPGNPASSDFWLSCPNQDPFLFLSTTERRVNIVITNSSLVFRQYGGMGLFQPYTDVDGNYPFPGIVHAQATSIRAFNETFGTNNRGILNPINFSALGCYQYRNNQSLEWFGITEDNNSGTQTGVPGLIWPGQGNHAEYSFNYAPIPTNAVGSPVAEDYNPNTKDGGGSFRENIWFDSDASVEPQGPAPLGLGSQLHYTTEGQLVGVRVNDTQQIGYIDGFQHTHMRGLSDFDEIQNQNGRRFVAFSDTGSSVLYRGVAMEII